MSLVNLRMTQGAIVSTFIPTDLSNLQLWLDSTDASTVNSGSPVNTDPVTLWNDKSGNGNNFTGAGSVPTYVTGGIGGKPSMNFPSGHEWFDGGTTNLFTQTSGYSIFFVLNLENISSIYRIMAQFAYVDASNTPTFFFGAGISGMCTAMTSQGATWGQPAYSIPSDAVGISSAYAWFYNGGGTTLTNYTAQAQFTNEVASNNPLSSAVDYKNYIGNYNSSLFGFMGNISEILVYNRQLNSTEIGQVNAYFRSKYGI